MTVFAGPSIFNNQQAYADWQRNKRSTVNKRVFKEANKGYKDWEEQPQAYKKRALKTSLLGNNYWMPEQDAEEFEQYLKASQNSEQYKKNSLLRNVHTPADFIDYAFTGSRLKNVETAELDSGHIRKVSYNPLYKILIVQFVKSASMGDTCAFFDLPANVAALLLHLTRTGQLGPSEVTKSGKVRERHQVGIEFWNLVRIRGTQHGVRYQFEYVPSDTIQPSTYQGKDVGRPKGYTGKDNKYFYDDSGRRYEKDAEGNPIIKSRGRPSGNGTNVPKTAKDEAAQAAHKEYVKRLAEGDFNKADSYIGESDEKITEHDLDLYFRDYYARDKKRLKGGQFESALQKAYDTYMNEDYNEPEEIAELIRKANGII